MKILTIVGARPQFIKAAVISRTIRSFDKIQEVIVHTGQHYDSNMSDIFFKQLDIPKPDYNLEIRGQLHGQMTGRQLEAIEAVLIKERPDWVLVYGDTNSTLAGTLAAVKLHIPVAHVEAGLRSFNRKMPEEINRVLTDHASDLLFAPTDNAINHLLEEGISAAKLRQVGDVMYDAVLFYAEKAEKYSCILQTLGLKAKEYILATLHRQENTDDCERLASIIQGLSTSAIPVVLPLHPRTRKQLVTFNIDLENPIYPVNPVGYLDMVMLEKQAQLIVTDSGGVQKEAYFHRVPCLTLRDETEWVELVEHGYNQLAGATKEKIKEIINKPPTFSEKFLKLYGDGNAGSLIINQILAIS